MDPWRCLGAATERDSEQAALTQSPAQAALVQRSVPAAAEARPSLSQAAQRLPRLLEDIWRGGDALGPPQSSSNRNGTRTTPTGGCSAVPQAEGTSNHDPPPPPPTPSPTTREAAHFCRALFIQSWRHCEMASETAHCATWRYRCHDMLSSYMAAGVNDERSGSQVALAGYFSAKTSNMRFSANSATQNESRARTHDLLLTSCSGHVASSCRFGCNI